MTQDKWLKCSYDWQQVGKPNVTVGQENQVMNCTELGWDTFAWTEMGRIWKICVW